MINIQLVGKKNLNQDVRTHVEIHMVVVLAIQLDVFK